MPRWEELCLCGRLHPEVPSLQNCSGSPSSSIPGSDPAPSPRCEGANSKIRGSLQGGISSEAQAKDTADPKAAEPGMGPAAFQPQGTSALPCQPLTPSLAPGILRDFSSTPCLLQDLRCEKPEQESQTGRILLQLCPDQEMPRDAKPGHSSMDPSIRHPSMIHPPHAVSGRRAGMAECKYM